MLPGSIGISGKGGTRYITIERNVFKNTLGRAVAVGGFTGLPYFRPLLPDPIVDAFEASDINVFSNVFINDEAPIAFVGAVNSTFRNNTIYKPQNWAMRILQENETAGFLPCSDNEFSNNIIYLQDDLYAEININYNSNVNPGSFIFTNNGWFNESSSNWSPDLPVTEQNQLFGNPLFVDAANQNFALASQSPFIGNGFSYGAPAKDFDQTAYSNPPSRGAFGSGDECELLTNTDFNNDLAPWDFYGCDVTSADGIATITGITDGQNVWDAALYAENILTEQGESYQVKFRARADANRTMGVKVGQNQSPFLDYLYQNVNLTTSMQDFTINFTMNEPSDYNTAFDFFIAGGNTTNVYIDNASLQKVNCETSCPEQGQSCNDDDPCTTVETYDTDCNCNGGTFKDSDNDGVCDAFDACEGINDAVIGTTCNDFNNCTTGDMYDANCNCAGTYVDADGDNVCSGNDPNDNDPCVPNSCDGGECELLTNTDFNDDLATWDYWGCTATSTNGVATMTGISNGQNVWDATFYTDNILTEQGESYQVKFSARADANRPMGVKVGQNQSPFLDYLYQNVNLTTSMQDFSLSFTMNESTDYNTAFDFFIAGGNTANVYIDNVSLKKTNYNIPPPSSECDCPNVVETGNTVTVQNVSQLRAALDQADSQGGNMTIKLEPGEYKVDYTIVINPNMPNLTIMGTTGNRDDVFIKGLGAFNSAVGAVILVQADNFTAAHFTVGESSTHAIQVQGDRDADNFTAVNVRFVDVYQQILKVSSGPNTYSDNGRVLCSAFEFTAGQAYYDYTRAIDCLKCRNWIVSNNEIKNIRSPNNEITEHAILFWRASEGTIVTNNKIMNSDRGIGFGLGNSPVDGHAGGGLIMNNFVHTNRDVGIGVEHAPGVKVYNNTVITENYPNSIEYRFPASTNVSIFNNLVSGNVTWRSDAPVTAADDNYRVFDLSIFANAGNYDYHLVGAPSGIVDAGTILSEVTNDIDCDNRTSGAGIDIGADEVSSFETTVCPEQLTIDQSITTGLYKAKTIIAPMAASGNMVSANSEVTFQAEALVNLESILIPKDCRFEIRIRGCNE